MRKNLLLTIGLTLSILSYSQADTISDNIYQLNGKIGIGTSIPRGPLHIKHPGIEYTTSGLILENNTSSSIYGLINTWDHFWIGFNENVAGNYPNYDFQHRFFIHQNGNVGIGTVHPSEKLDVEGNIIADGYKLTNGTMLVETSVWNKSGDSIFYNNGNVGIGTVHPSEKLDVEGNIIADGYKLTNGTMLETSVWNKSGESIFYNNGNVGIGTEEPTSKLQIANGDIYISDIEKGIIMKSPDGNCWRGVLDNSGQLIFSSVGCPETDIINNTQQIKSSLDIIIFPNPSKTNITVHLLNDEIKKAKYGIYNMSGRNEKSGKIKSINQIINISDLSMGTYLINIYDMKGDKLTTQKIIKE